jgi:hypothetical protein
MLNFFLNLFRSNSNQHPALSGEMKLNYNIKPYGLFSFQPGNAVYELRSDVFGQETDIELDVRTSNSFDRAISCLRKLDIEWFEKAILYTTNEEYILFEDFIGEPEIWVDRQTFINNIKKSPILQIWVEDDECSVSLTLNDGVFFGGHFIVLEADEFGKIDHVGVHG